MLSQRTHAMRGYNNLPEFYSSCLFSGNNWITRAQCHTWLTERGGNEVELPLSSEIAEIERFFLLELGASVG